jgi:hypothetical protein
MLIEVLGLAHIVLNVEHEAFTDAGVRIVPEIVISG